MLLVIFKSIIGPRITDRVVSVNMIGTLVIISICILSFILKESYLLDVSFIYVLISFLAVVVLSSVFINSYLEKKKKEQEINSKEEKCNDLIRGAEVVEIQIKTLNDFEIIFSNGTIFQVFSMVSNETYSGMTFK